MKKDSNDTEPELAVGPCPCGNDCGGARFTIINPQISDSGECYATLPRGHILDLIEALKRIHADG